MIHTRVLKADGLLLITAIIWGSAFVAQRAGMDHVGPHTFNGIRFALGAMVLLPAIIHRERRPDIPKYPNRNVVLSGVALGAVLFGGAALQQIGLVHTTAGKAGFITGLYVILVPMLSLLLGRFPNMGGWIGAVLSLTGLYLLSVTDGLSLAPGDLRVLMGAFFWASHMLMVSNFTQKLDVLKLAFAQFVVCSILSLTTAGLTEDITLSGIWEGAVPILFGGMVSVGIAYTLQVVAQKDAPSVHAAVILSLESLFAAIAGWLILDESMTLRMIMGCGLMLSGMLVVQLWPEPAAKSSEESVRSMEAV